jgi:hypothetical protein
VDSVKDLGEKVVHTLVIFGYTLTTANSVPQ